MSTEDEIDVDALQQEVEARHGCKARFVRMKRAEESFGCFALDADVYLFDLEGHPDAKQCFAWSSRRAGAEKRYVETVLRTPPVKTAGEALWASFVRGLKERAKQS